MLRALLYTVLFNFDRAISALRRNICLRLVNEELEGICGASTILKNHGPASAFINHSVRNNVLQMLNSRLQWYGKIMTNENMCCRNRSGMFVAISLHYACNVTVSARNRNGA